MWSRNARGWKAHFSGRLWLLLGLLALLPVTAFLQYRWIGEVSDAAAQRAKARLESSLEQMITEFDGEITRAHMTFWQMPSEQESPATRIAERYRDWNRLAPYSQLIRNVRLIEAAQEPWTLSRIDPSGSIVRLPEWPADLAEVRSRLQSISREGPGRSGLQGYRRIDGIGDLAIGGNPAFVVPLREPRGEQERADRRPVGWAVVVLDADFIRRDFFPYLARRLFGQGGESEYELLMLKAGDPENIVFQSDPALKAGVFATPDATASMFAMRPGCFVPDATSSGSRAYFAGDFPGVRRSEILTQEPFPCGAAARALGSTEGAWKLLVKRRAGPFGAALASFRMRTTLISFGVLLVLALGITMLTISTERARVLAKLQMEFAMGISHELRTPLTVIRVAADNLANGMMANASHAEKYGRLIGDEARRLTDMVEQILLFARTQSPGGAELAAAAPEAIVARALTAYGPALREAGMTVERAIEPGLPEILVDANQIVGCVQNLLQNAVKYAVKGGWVQVRAESVRREDGTWVRIAVQDRGPGVETEDLPHIFDPFQRGEGARNSQIPGVGLGLSLVKRIIEAHQGTVEVQTSTGSGATFCLYLPAQPARTPAPVEIKEVTS